MKPQKAEIIVIGVNASGIDSLPLSQIKLISSSKRIAAPSRLCDSVYKWRQKLAHKNPLPEIHKTDNINNLIKWIKNSTDQTIILASGDPLWFGIGRVLINNFPNKNIDFHPSATSFQLAFAKLGIPWQDASLISLHGRDPSPLAKLLQKRPKSIAILTDKKRGGAKEVLNFLIASGLKESYEFWIFEKLGHENEKIRKINKESEIDDNIDPLHLVILIENITQPKRNPNLPLFGIEDGYFMQLPDRPGLMTKRESRIQLIAELELPEKGVLWDVGAGVGSLGLESLRIRPNLTLISIEKRLGSKLIIEENSIRLGVKPNYIFEANALDILKEDRLNKKFRQPDRVILGGGGEDRIKLLKAIMKKLKPNGIVVIPLATIQAINDLENVLKSYKCIINISQLQSYRGVSIGNGIRLNPMNPIFILKGKLN